MKSFKVRVEEKLNKLTRQLVAEQARTAALVAALKAARELTEKLRTIDEAVLADVIGLFKFADFMDLVRRVEADAALGPYREGAE